ncbi:MAG: hypothetical protein AAF487_13270, partial [Bacteroidota bacterium]
MTSTPGTTQIEGIPTSETRGVYGGTDDADNSGVLKYVSIRHGGTDVGAGNEINGLTLAGVGSGTVIEHIEVIANKDDGVEFFGGTVSAKWVLTAFCGDDNYDYDEGWRGNGQFWVVVAADDAGDRGGEHDGGTDPETASPFATPSIWNATYIGRGITAGKRALTFRDNAGGSYSNSVFFNWGKGVDVENLESGDDSYARFVAGDLSLNGNVFYNTVVSGNGATEADLFKISMGSWSNATDSMTELATSTAALQATFAAGNNSVEDPGLAWDLNAGSIQLVPQNSLSEGTAPGGTWFENVTYKGAFDPNGTNWVKG